jgi:hypothetical protein
LFETLKYLSVRVLENILLRLLYKVLILMNFEQWRKNSGTISQMGRKCGSISKSWRKLQ